MHKIFMSSAARGYSEFSSPTQGVWQLIPVEGKKNVFYLKNKLFQQNLIAKHVINSKSHRRNNRRSQIVFKFTFFNMYAYKDNFIFKEKFIFGQMIKSKLEDHQKTTCGYSRANTCQKTNTK